MSNMEEAKNCDKLDAVGPPKGGFATLYQLMLAVQECKSKAARYSRYFLRNGNSIY